ncbi:MAG: hypothetical protein IKD76_01030 [Clostridia bacterium]|nr:hypothetical protein [Clostridia bacterium]
MKLSNLCLRGALCTLGSIVNENVFSALICVISTLKNTSVEDEIPKEFSYQMDALHTESNFIQSCDLLVEYGLCMNVEGDIYSFTGKGEMLLEAWVEAQRRREAYGHWSFTENG